MGVGTMNKLANGVYKITLGEPEKITPVKILKPEMKYMELNSLKDNPMPFPKESILSKKTSRGYLLEIPLDGGEDVYGLGLQLKSFRQTGKKKMLRTNSDPAADTGDSHAPVPFYVTSKGYGVMVDTARYATFYCGNVKKVGGDRDIAGFISSDNPQMWWQINEGSGNMIIDIPTASGADIYIFSGCSMKDAVCRYNLFCGGGAKIPIWGLGILYRGYMRATESEILNLANGLREDRLPCDVFGLEPGWQTHAYSSTYLWDENKFPNHESMADKLSQRGFKLNLWEQAYVHSSCPIYDEIKPFSGNNYVWDGCIPDFATESGTRIFLKMQEKLIDDGVSGFKLDECDNSDYLSNWGFPEYTEFPSGADGEQMHSMFGLLYQRTMLLPYQKRNRRTMGQVRQSGLCSSPYPYVLYSDLYNHSDFVRGMGSAAFCGLLWSPEVRQAQSEEELLRRIAAVIASPQALLNCFMIPSPPWKQFDLEKNIAGKLLDNKEELTDKVRSLFELRMSLVVHLYTAFSEYSLNGLPPVRPLVMDFPEDKNTYDIFDEYMLGEGLLAAPVIFENGDNKGRNIYFPEGDWYDFYTGEKTTGGQSLYFTVAADKLPLFVRENTLLAIAKPLQYIDENTKFDITLKAYGKDSQCKLNIDKGLTFDGNPIFITATVDGFCGNELYSYISIEKYYK